MYQTCSYKQDSIFQTKPSTSVIVLLTEVDPWLGVFWQIIILRKLFDDKNYKL